MLILGLNNGVDGGAALIDDGRVLSAINEERLNRKKNFWGPPLLAIEAVLRDAGVAARDVEHVAQSSLTSGGGPHLRFEEPPPMKRLIEYVSLLPYSHSDVVKQTYLAVSGRRRRDVVVDQRLRELGCHAPKRYIEHHHCHAASAYYCSPYGDVPEDVLVVTADGTGDGICHSFATVTPDHQLVRRHSSMIFHSIAEVYGYVTHNLGFKYNRHEGKITGLAAYGDASKTIGAFRRVMGYDPERLELRCSVPWGRPGARMLRKMLDGHSREDVAAGVQQAIEEVMAGLVSAALRRYGKKYLCVAGGLFCNVRLNQVLREIPGVEDVYVQPGMADTGQGLGAALGLWAELRERPKPVPLRHAYLGNGFSDSEIEHELRSRGLSYRRSANVHAETAELLAQKKIVARFAGRMEYGPRALGHRSIMYDTSDKSVNDWLNKRLGRTEFMPFAPILLKDRASEFLENWDDDKSAAAQFMTITYRMTPLGQMHSPAITHVDGTARPQVVTREDNPDSHAILTEYEARTGRPILVNTSFNMHEEPIVCTPADAVSAFLRGHLDVLSIGSFVVVQTEQAGRAAPQKTE
jgi:carbamoyltransferase